VSISTDTAPQRELLASGRVYDMEGTLVAIQLLTARTGRAFGEFPEIRELLEVVVTGVAEVSAAEAEEDGHRATVAALVLQEVGAVFGTHLSARYVRTAATDQL